jgi:demethylmenaquinone methyltransferase/2-methoxy-6-polyprenyl-1,4-benzoquinol methylase
LNAQLEFSHLLDLVSLEISMSTEVNQMFSRIADRYDLANRFISMGTDQRVRRRAVAMADANRGEDVLDCAAGTGDLTILFAEAVGAGAHVVGTDFNEDMLSHGPDKAAEHGVDITWQVEDAQELSFEDDSFDIVSIAYGIRNVDDPIRALESMTRVLRPGGRLVVIEFGQPPAMLRPFYLAYNRWVIPAVGAMVGGDREAYRYLQRTSDTFAYGEDFVEMMEATGCFEHIEAEPAMFGVNYIYVGTLPG